LGLLFAAVFGIDHAPGSLKALIGVCYDGHRGYRTAASYAGSMEMKRFLAKLSAEREQFGEQLLHKLGTGLPAYGSFTGTLHRRWIDLRDKLGAMSQADLLQECVRGETVAIGQYEDVLAKQMPADVRAVVANQLGRILETRERLVQLADEGG